MDAGDCFYNQATKGVPSHPWIIVSDTALDPENVLIVNITDRGNHHDHTCVLDSTDEQWITKPSCAAYQYAKLTTVRQLEAAESAGLLFNRQTASESTLTKIRDGAALSEETKGVHLRLLREQGLA